MLNKKIALIFLATILILSLVGLITQPDVKASEGCITGQCHSGLLKLKNVHPVAESCDSCHQPTGASHPQKGKKTFNLVQEGGALCSMCHPSVVTKKNIHPPVKDGMCTSCHNPHASNEKKLLLEPTGLLCSTCHPGKADHKFVHGPTATGDCDSCHSPHDSDNKALIIQPDPELCFTCHFDFQETIKKKNVHPALLSGCTSCHNPHGSAERKLLPAEGDKLCYQCHPQIEEKTKKAKSIHAPITSQKSCASCHSPHASETQKLLPKIGKDLCLDCHKGIIKKTYTLLHGPIKEGNCSACHDPHGSQYSKLVTKSYSSDPYIPYSDKEYELCFSCHNRDLLRFPDTSFATDFRDGDKNLHYIHVNRKDKGRNCNLCHAIHGGTLPKLISETVPFGKWDLPLNFIKTDTGGSCTPGCHKKYNYDRNVPGRAPEIKKEEKGTPR